MKLYLPNGALKRPARTDVSDLTTAKRTGEPYWDEGDILVSPFDRELTATEQEQIERRLTTETSAEEALQEWVTDVSQKLLAYENLTTPTNPQTVAVLRILCKAMRLRLERRLDAMD